MEEEKRSQRGGRYKKGAIRIDGCDPTYSGIGGNAVTREEK